MMMVVMEMEFKSMFISGMTKTNVAMIVEDIAPSSCGSQEFVFSSMKILTGLG